MCVYWEAFPCGVSMCLDRCIISAPVIRQSSWHSWPWWGLERDKFSALPNLDWGEGWGLQQGEMVVNQGCSAEPEMVSMKIQNESWLSFNNPELSPFSPYANKSLLILFIGNPTACVNLSHPHTRGTSGIPHISQITCFPPVSVLRQSQASTDIFPKKHQKHQKHWDPAVLCCVTFQMCQ